MTVAKYALDRHVAAAGAVVMPVENGAADTDVVPPVENAAVDANVVPPVAAADTADAKG